MSNSWNLRKITNFINFFNNIHKVQNNSYSWNLIVILHPMVRLKSETPYLIMKQDSGSKSGNKIFYTSILVKRKHKFMKNEN